MTVHQQKGAAPQVLPQLPVAPLRPRRKAEVEAVDWALVLAVIAMETMAEAKAVEAERVAEQSNLRSRLARNSKAHSRQRGEANALSAAGQLPTMRRTVTARSSGASATPNSVE